MKFIAELPVDNLLQSAIMNVANHSELSDYLIQRAITALNHHISNKDDDPSKWDQSQDQAIILLLNFAHSLKGTLEGGNSVNYIYPPTPLFDKLTPSLDFPWQSVKKQFIDIYKLFSGKLVYRDWKIEGKNNIDYGVIEHRIEPDAKIAIIGDWGTGSNDAKALLAELLKYEDRPDIIIHLGDIYNSCTEYEMKENFRNPIKNAFDDAGYEVPVYTIPGNHDYFAGGQPFYDLIDSINKISGYNHKYYQEASYFCLRTTDNSWQFLGGDTGINDHSYKHRVQDPPVKPSELEWHMDKLNNFRGKTFFMTHHPLINAVYSLNKSSHKNLAPFNLKLLKQFQSKFGDSGKMTDKIDYWFWGHDHYMVAFNANIKDPLEISKNAVIPKCRLLGGSAREKEDFRFDKNSIDLILKKDGKLVQQDNNNGFVNHTWCLVDLGTKKISYYQMPAWESGGTDIPSLPRNQKFKFFEEDI